MLFRNEEASLQLDIVNYEFPDAAPGSEDSQWLVLQMCIRDRCSIRRSIST